MARNRKTIRNKKHLDPSKIRSHSFMTGQCDPENAVAYCHNKSHIGYLSAKMVKQHDCNTKQCPYLEKYETRSYWLRRNIISVVKKYRKNGNTGVIMIGNQAFMDINVERLVSVAHAYTKEYGKPPEIIYIKDYIKYYCTGEL